MPDDREADHFRPAPRYDPRMQNPPPLAHRWVIMIALGSGAIAAILVSLMEHAP